MDKALSRQDIYDYYSNKFVTEKIMNYARGREVAGAFWDGSYDKRPNILQFPSDVAQMVRNGVTSFHLSVEHWSNPMAISTDNYDRLRSGWDMIIDIDSKLGLDEARTAAEMVCRVLERYGIRSYGIKFSGRRGFHICLPWKMFPKTIDYTPSEKLYPQAPRIIARFIRRKISNDLMKELIRSKGAKQLMEMMGEVPEKISPYFFVEIEKDWGNRHMFRAPFSLNEKTWMASVPLSMSQMKNFDPKIAEPMYVIENQGVYEEFLKGEENEAQDLVMDAFDWFASKKKEEPKKEKKVLTWEGRIAEEYFPPCIKNILSGLQDGRKRSIFTLINFLKMMNWRQDEIEKKIFEWNERNTPPLPRSTLLSTIRYHERRNQVPPANCPPDGDLFYTDSVGVCRPDGICMGGTGSIVIKNPIVYPFRMMKTTKKEKSFRGYSCGLCSKEFKSMRSLNMHKSRTHGYVQDA